MKIYIERKINSESDLPKESGGYFVITKSNHLVVNSAYHEYWLFNDNQKKNWIKCIDFWFEPVEVPEWDKFKYTPREYLELLLKIFN